MVRILSENVLADGTVSAAGIETQAYAGGTQNNVAITNETQRLLLENAPNWAGITLAMAVAIAGTTTDGTVFATGSWTPVIGTEYLIFVANSSPGTVPTSVVKSGLTVSPSSTAAGGASDRVTVYAAVGTAATASTLSVTYPVSQTGCLIAVIAVTGAHPSAYVSAVGTNLFTSAIGGSAIAGATLTANTPNSRSKRLVGAAIQDASVAPNTDTGYTSLATGTFLTPSTGFNVKYKNTADGIFTFTTAAAALTAIIVGVNPPSPGALTLTGFASGWDGRQITIHNLSQAAATQSGVDAQLYTEADDLVILRHNSGSSTSANRLLCPGGTDYYLGAGGSVTLIYDASWPGWRVVGNLRYGPIVRTYTADATWTRPAGLDHITVEVCGGGGGGGGVTASATAAHVSIGGAGGGGGYARRLYTAAELSSASYTVVVGTGGTGGTGGAGNAGGTSEFGITGNVPVTGGVSATGGPGGVRGSDRTTDLVEGPTGGGVGVGGDINVNAGFTGYGSIVSGIPIGTAGGNSFFGGGAEGVRLGATGSIVGNPGKDYGGGGTGASTRANATNVKGGDGARGVVIVTEHYN